jgi:hypothetical protein
MAGISPLCVRRLERHYAGLGHREHRLGDPLRAARVFEGAGVAARS